MTNSVKERLIAFINYKGISKNKFEILCGLSKRYVSNISKSISPDVAKRISLNFPELNMGWILTGDGEMLEKSGAPDNGPSGLEDIIKANLNLSETIRQQQETIHLLTKMLNQRDSAPAPKKDIVG